VRLIDFIHNINKYHSKNIRKNLEIFLNLLQNLQKIHFDNITHNYLTPDNIYAKIETDEVFFGHINLNLKLDYSDIWYSPPELSFYYHSNNFQYENSFEIRKKSDVWYLGCLLAEMFFVSSPLFKIFSHKSKISKVIEMLGMPEYEDVIDYINLKDYRKLKEVTR
jgi:serine/threonine protein kinase